MKRMDSGLVFAARQSIPTKINIKLLLFHTKLSFKSRAALKSPSNACYVMRFLYETNLKKIDFHCEIYLCCLQETNQINFKDFSSNFSLDFSLQRNITITFKPNTAHHYAALK